MDHHSQAFTFVLKIVLSTSWIPKIIITTYIVDFKGHFINDLCTNAARS